MAPKSRVPTTVALPAGGELALAGSPVADARLRRLGVREQAGFALLCLGAGVAPLAARWIAGDVARIAYGALITAAYLACALFARHAAALRRLWKLAFAFFIFALVQVLNRAIPGFVAGRLLHAPPRAGNPLAATVSGTLVVQVLETAIAIVPVVAFTLLSGQQPGAIYARAGKFGGWLIFASGFLIVFYGYLATLVLRPESPAHRLLPTHGPLTLQRFLALTPPLLVVAIANGFEEEVLFRGLFLQPYQAVFGVGVANVLQAAIFALAHAGIAYTPAVLLFIVALVFPLGLVTGYLMRVTNGVLAPAIFHAALDLAIYLPFLTAVA